jgi:cell division protein ZapA (FtsZ GTPase activity inhibitor)
MTQSAVAKWHIEHEAGEAVRRAGLNYDHPVRAMLERSAVIAGVRQGVVRTPNESGELVTLDERIKEMRNEERYSALFPRPEGTVAKSDMQRISENFEAIAAGNVEVQ